MNERNKKLVAAAQTVFAKYGISKTTMNDIAREAGVARQTLYNAYPSKEAILRATVRFVTDETFATLEATTAGVTDLNEMLQAFFTHVPLYWYDVVMAAPEVADLIDGLHVHAHDELVEVDKRWVAWFTALARDYATDGSKAAASAAEIADFIYSTSMNAKHNASSRVILEQRLNILRLSAIALITNDAG